MGNRNIPGTPQLKSALDVLAAPEPKVIVTLAELAAAFTEWERRYREEPDKFMSEASKLLNETPQSYGEACAPYFVEILAELRKR